MYHSCGFTSANRFRPITQPTVLSGFGQLTSLALNQTLVSWAEVVNLAPSLSKLRHLELGYNNITSLDSPAGLVTPSEGLTRLEELNLAGNQLTAWDHISTQLSTLPALVRIACQITDNSCCVTDSVSSFLGSQAVTLDPVSQPNPSCDSPRRNRTDRPPDSPSPPRPD